MKSDELIADYCFDATDNQTKAVYPKMNSLEWARLMLKVESKCLKKAEEYK